jgi:Transposase zinc-binding domain
VQPLVPARVRGEVERYLRCGDVRYGFVEATCAKCEVPRLVALRWRGRGWCPSCTTRRALETGLQLEEELPRVAHRQWTLSLPMAARFQVVKKPALLKRLEVRLVQAVWRRQRATARRLGTSTKGLRGGGVCFWQYFGSSLQLTPHLHLLVPEALWTPDGEVVTLPPPDDADVRAVLERVLRQARRDLRGGGRGVAAGRVRGPAGAGAPAAACAAAAGERAPSAQGVGGGGLLAPRGHGRARKRQGWPGETLPVRSQRAGV